MTNIMPTSVNISSKAKRIIILAICLITHITFNDKNGALAYMYRREQNNGMSWRVADNRLAQMLPNGHDPNVYNNYQSDLNNWVIVSLKEGLPKKDVDNHINWLVSNINSSKVSSDKKVAAASNSKGTPDINNMMKGSDIGINCLYQTGYAGRFPDEMIKKLEKRKDVMFVRRDKYLGADNDEYLKNDNNANKSTYSGYNNYNKVNESAYSRKVLGKDGGLGANVNVNVNDNDNDSGKNAYNGISSEGNADVNALNKPAQSITKQGLSFPNGPSWGLDRINQRMLPLDGFFSSPSPRGAGVDVYVLDAGVKISHSEFDGRAKNGATFVTNSSDDKFGHGTHVAGIIAGKNTGVANQANIISVKVMYDNGKGPVSSIIMGLDWAVRNARLTRRPSIINMSIGTDSKDDSLDHAVLSAVRQGIIVIASGGNNNKDSCNYSPSNLSSVLTVGATDPYDKKAPYSNYGKCIKLYAPGSYIRSASNLENNSYKIMNGTSMAAPFVAGAVAVHLSRFPNSPPMETMRTILATSSQKSVRDSGYAGGYAPILYVSDGSSSYRIYPYPSAFGNFNAPGSTEAAEAEYNGDEMEDYDAAIDSDYKKITARPRKLPAASTKNTSTSIFYTLLVSISMPCVISSLGF